MHKVTMLLFTRQSQVTFGLSIEIRAASQAGTQLRAVHLKIVMPEEATLVVQKISCGCTKPSMRSCVQLSRPASI